MKYSLNLVTILLFLSSLVCAQTRVACVGNSITMGRFINEPEIDCYPSQLGMILGDSYEVKNFGVSGRTMLKKGNYPIWVESLFLQAFEYKPNIVVILLGTNDSKEINWTYKDEFIPDYISMINQFRELDPEPVIYACYPPPSWDVTWGIRGAIIAGEIIPMIEKIIDSVGVSLIDFHSPLEDKEFLFPDKIHPMDEGSWEMAKIAANSIAGVNIETMNDVNVAKGQSVTVNDFDKKGGCPEYLNDGDRLTKWKVEGFGSWAIVDIGDPEEIDMFQLDFNEKSSKGFQYIIEASTDTTSWTKVVDQSARDDTVSQICVDKIDPTTARYVKITINGASNSSDEKISISEFRILKSAFFHAPVFSWISDSASASTFRYYLDIKPTSNAGELQKIYTKIDDGYFNTLNGKGFRAAENQQIVATVSGQVHQFYTAIYKDAKMMISDTLTLNFEILSYNPDLDTSECEPPIVPSSIEQDISISEPEFELSQNYPNPFNPFTTIKYILHRSSNIILKIYNHSGQELETLVNEYQTAGEYEITWQTKELQSGIYYYKLQAGEFSDTKKLILHK